MRVFVRRPQPKLANAFAAWVIVGRILKITPALMQVRGNILYMEQPNNSGSVEKTCTMRTHCNAELRALDENETPYCLGCSKVCSI